MLLVSFFVGNVLVVVVVVGMMQASVAGIVVLDVVDCYGVAT